MTLSRPITRALVSAGVATVLAGCATQPDGVAYLTGERWHRTELNTYDVLVISVDGEHHIERRNLPVIVEPGLRRIVVQAPPVTGFTYGEQRTLTLDVKPCTRYWLEAKKPGPLSQDFEPRVNYTEPVAGCRPPGKQ